MTAKSVQQLVAEAPTHEPSATLAEAWIKAQSMMQHAAQSGKNKFLKDDDGKAGRPYSTLADVIDAVKPALTACGIGYTQKIKQKAGMVQVKTVFTHVNGEKMDNGWLPVPAEKPTAHGYGTALTYAKRYSLAAACGISADPDSDGNPVEQKSTGALADTIAESVGADKNTESTALRIAEDIDSCFTLEGEGRSAVLVCVAEPELEALIEELKKDNEMKLVVWNKLGSKVRSYIKDWEKMRG